MNMRKIVLTGGTAWFDADAAKEFKPTTYIANSGREACLATGVPGFWEALYLTPGGSFVLVSYCEDGRPENEQIVEIDRESGARWLLENGYQEELKKLEMGPEESALEI
jgi:hypothetical protein